MSLWNKIVLGAKFLFSGFESAADYALNLLNKFIEKPNITANIQKAREYVETCLGYMRKYKDFCPVKWTTHYQKVIDATQTLSNVFEDNKVTPEELEKAIADVRAAIDEWFKD